MAGDECGGGNVSAEAELLSEDCRKPVSCGSHGLRRPPGGGGTGEARFPRRLHFSGANDHRKQNREEATTENAQGLLCCEASQGETESKVVRPVPFNV